MNWQFFTDQVLWASVVAYVLCFVLTMVFLRKRVKPLENILVSLVTMFSGVMLYEIVYHYSWSEADTLARIWQDISWFTLGGTTAFPLLFYTSVMLAPLLAWRYITLNKAFAAILATGVAFFVVWVGLGFQQFWCLCEGTDIFGQYLPTSQIETIGYWMNSFSKIISIAPAFLFYPSPSLITRQKIAGWLKRLADRVEPNETQKAAANGTMSSGEKNPSGEN
jgi:hypothetical protein